MIRLWQVKFRAPSTSDTREINVVAESIKEAIDKARSKLKRKKSYWKTWKIISAELIAEA